MKNKGKLMLAVVTAVCMTAGVVVFAPDKVMANDSGFASISTGSNYTMAIKSDGTLWAWGKNWAGQLGDGTTTNRLSPVKVMDNVAVVSPGSSYTMAIKTDRTLWAWGNNLYGQLGDSTTTDRHSPVKIMDNVASVLMLTDAAMVIKTDGTLWAWGENRDGQLGDGTTKDRHSPVKIMDNVKTVLEGGWAVRAIKADGTLWTWGRNLHGMLGDGTTASKLSPVKVMDNVAKVFTGSNYTMTIKTDGTLWAWGWNGWGMLGDGTTIDRLSPVKIMDNVTTVSTKVGNGGGGYTMAIKTDGTLWAWGNNEMGQLGIGTGGGLNDYYATPVKIMDSVKAVYMEAIYATAIKTDGSLWAWGINYTGSLGDGTTTDRMSPVKIMDNVEMVWMGRMYNYGVGDLAVTMVIKKDGSMWAWGGVWSINGSNGGFFWDNLQPTPVKIMNNVAMVQLENYLAWIVQTDGTLWGWGANATGGLGDGTTNHRVTPVKIMDSVKLPDSLHPATSTPAPNSSITVLFKGEKLNLALPILNINGRTMYPFRECLEAMGAEVSWNAGTKTAKGALNGKTVEFAIDSGTYKADGKQMEMDTGVTAFIRDGRTYIPIRYAAEGLGFTVEWDEKTQTINIK